MQKAAEVAGAVVVFVIASILVMVALEVARREMGWEPVGRLARLVPSLPPRAPPSA